jgi:tetratricopeptide (TPR) repeat protein
MGSKESMVTAPLTVALYDRIFVFRSLRDTFRHRWPLYLGLSATWLFLAAQVAATPRANSAGFTTNVSVWTYLLNQAAIIVRYLRLVFWPVDLVINYGQPAAYTLREVLPQAVVVMALLSLTVAAFRWNTSLAFLGAWFFITLAPTSSVLPIATEVAAERRMYLPLMAVITAIVMTLYGSTRLRQHVSRAVTAVAVAAIGIALGAGTIRRNAEHQSWLTLARTTLDRWPSDAAYAGVGSELARLRQDEEALPLLRIAARTEPRARYNLGVTLFNLKRDEDAIRELEVLVKEHPMREEVPWARKVMGHAYLRLSRWPDAIAQLRMVLTMTPNDAEARRLLVEGYNTYGVSLAQAGDFGSAISQFKYALTFDERNESAQYNLATALFDAGRMHESFVEIERALELGPNNADAHHLKGKLLALQGRMPESIASLETAIKLSPNDPLIREDLSRVRQAR